MVGLRHLCVAVLIISSLWGCAHNAVVQKGEPAMHHLARAHDLLIQGDYSGALEENRKVVSMGGSTAVQEALFYSGLIYAGQTNPKRDYEKALSYFRQLVNTYPQSTFAAQARIVMGMVEDNIRLTKAIETSGRIAEENVKLRGAVEKLSQIAEENSRLRAAVERLNQMAEESRKVDREIEGMKRGKAR